MNKFCCASNEGWPRSSDNYSKLIQVGVKLGLLPYIVIGDELGSVDPIQMHIIVLRLSLRIYCSKKSCYSGYGTYNYS